MGKARGNGQIRRNGGRDFEMDLFFDEVILNKIFAFFW